jgi:hypothetical protein
MLKQDIGMELNGKNVKKERGESMASLKDLMVTGPARFLDKLYGNLEGNATSANKWSTPRSFTIGKTARSVDGSVNVAWTYNEIGASVSNAWGAGTSAGPTLTTTVNGVASTAVAIPSASTSASGIVTTGEQSFTGVKKFASTVYANSGLYIGSNANGDNNFITFYGTTGDGPGSYNHTFIGENLYGGTEGSELVLFKGNDIDNNSGGSPGPDRIRHIAARHLFQTYDTALSGSWTTICDSTTPVTKLEIRPNLIRAYTTTSINTDTADYSLNAASFICDSWVRTKGDTGWYNETYGGGWHMNDTAWIRAYNGKSVYVANTSNSAIYTSGAVRGTKGFTVDETLAIYPEKDNEMNFGGTGTNTTIYMGYRATGSRAIPTKFVFGSSGGTASLQCNTVYLGSGTSSYVSSTQYTGNAATATKLASARTLTIGNTGKSFDGSSNVSWSLNEIGALAHFIKTGTLDLDTFTSTGYYTVNSSTLTNHPETGHGIMFVDYNVGTPVQFYMHDTSFTLYKRHRNNTTGGWNAWSSTLGNSISGNAATATKLATARTLTIGNSGKPFDGSGNVSWPLSEIGAMATDGSTYQVALTGGADNTTGYRLIGQASIVAWNNRRLSFIVTSRHTGNGLVTINYGCNNGTVTTGTIYCHIKYFGISESTSGSPVSTDSFTARASSDGTTMYFFWRYHDYNGTYITVLGNSGAFTPSNGTWTLDPSTYGALIASTQVNVADSLASTLALNKGGTGATTKTGAKTNLGITYGTTLPTSGMSEGDIFFKIG